MNRTHLFLTVNTKHMMKSGAPPDKFGAHVLCLPMEFHGFTSSNNSKGYNSLVPGLISIHFRDGMGPFKCSDSCIKSFSSYL